MSRYNNRNAGSDNKLYVGDLGSSASKQDLEDAFGYYGPLRNVWVARNPPGFAFIEFEDVRDAEDAVRGLDGRTVCGRRIRVEQSNGKGGGRRRDSRGGRPPSRRGGGSGGSFNPDDRCYECGDRGHYARDCRRRGSGGGGGFRSRGGGRGGDNRDRSRSQSRSRSRGRSRSRSAGSRGKSRSASPVRGKSGSRSRSRGGSAN